MIKFINNKLYTIILRGVKKVEDAQEIELDNQKVKSIEEEKTEEKPGKKFCLQCNIEIHPGRTRFSARKFCSRRCNRRYFSLKRYHKIKNNDDYKAYRKKYYKIWLDKNRAKFNKSMREVSLRYQRKMKALKEEAKLKEQTFNNDSELNKLEVDN